MPLAHRREWVDEEGRLVESIFQRRKECYGRGNEGDHNDEVHDECCIVLEKRLLSMEVLVYNPLLHGTFLSMGSEIPK